MKESNLLKISVITALVGILVLLFILDRIDLSNADIVNLTKEDIDKKVEIKGELISITETPGLYILNVKDFSGTITVIVFKEDDLELKKGDILEIEGQVTSYKDKLEIIAKKITVL
ncbi:MAG: OB-fold nucleic acid binding domain-containing protein [Nanoarchaeota archaeon]|mgnify:CR=1 FL=1